MTTYKKLGLIVAFVCVIILAVWFYYFWEYNLPELLPQDTWTKVEIHYTDDGPQRQEWKDPDLEAVLDAISKTRVHREDAPSRTLSDHFLLMLYSEENQGTGPTLIYVEKNGKLRIAANMDLDHYRHYVEGEELYQMLLTLCQE